MKQKTKVFLPIILFVVYLILDYINLIDLIGLSVDNINIDILGVLFDAVIVIVLYIISFYYIDKKQLEKDKNAKGTANILFQKTYNECLENLKFLDDKGIVGRYIIPKIDGDKVASEDRITNNFQTLPFSSFETIMSLSSNGYIEKNDLNDYLDVKMKYQNLVNLKITFFDIDNAQTLEQQAMAEKIKNDDRFLKSKLEELSSNYKEN